MADLLFIAGIVVLILIVAVIAYLNYCGLFHRIEIRTGAPFIQNATVMYKFGQGPYSDSGRIFSEMERLAPKAKCIGIYYDDPDKVSAANLRYAAGIVLTEGKGKTNSDVQKKMEAEGFKLFDLPDAKNYVCTTFPFLNMVSLYIGYKRVYPKLIKYMEENKLTMKVMVEVYTNNMTQFMGPQDHEEEFFVPEAIETETDEHRK